LCVSVLSRKEEKESKLFAWVKEKKLNWIEWKLKVVF
jgi:hypothetical protein